ncbi:MAG: prepilin-type N-terminal cleavage/methylation domain-containing protein, partial [Pseudomonadota bacterium]
MGTPKSQAGFSLIEVLVALLVLSVGLLTVAALQVYSLQVEANALNGTRAT